MGITDVYGTYSLPYKSLLRTGNLYQWGRLLTMGLRVISGRQAFPRQAVIALTYRCQYECAHCCVGEYEVNPSEELRKDEINSLLEEFKRMGICFVTWFGGEPLLRQDLSDFVAQATSLGMFSTVETNGLLLDESRVKQLKESGLSRICISLDSCDAEKHDSHRGYSGAFDAVTDGIKVANRYGIPCTVSVTVQHETLQSGEIKRLVEHSREIGAAAVRFVPPVCTGRWLDKEVRLSEEDTAVLWNINRPGFTYVEHLLNNSNKLFFCDAARYNKIYVASNGDVHPCEFVPVSFGNIREEGIRDIFVKMHEYPDLGTDCGECVSHCDHTRDIVTSHMENKGKLPVKWP